MIGDVGARPFRVFNQVHKVRTMWRVAGLRLGGIGQFAALTLMAGGVVMIDTAGTVLTAMYAFVAFSALVFYTWVLGRVDPEGVLTERSALSCVRALMFRRYTCNFDLDTTAV